MKKYLYISAISLSIAFLLERRIEGQTVSPSPTKTGVIATTPTPYLHVQEPNDPSTISFYLLFQNGIQSGITISSNDVTPIPNKTPREWTRKIPSSAIPGAILQLESGQIDGKMSDLSNIAPSSTPTLTSTPTPASTNTPTPTPTGTETETPTPTLSPTSTKGRPTPPVLL